MTAPTVHHGDCLDVMRAMPANSVDAVITDPPYNLSFMAKPWDAYNGQEDAGFASWLSGLIDGEGHFAIKHHTRGTYAPAFALKLRADERGTLETIARRVGAGTVTLEPHEPNPMAKWAVQDKAGCQRLVDLLDKYPLRAKKLADYWAWREAVCEWTERPRGNRWHGAADNTRMAALRDRLMAGRAYSDISWSGNEFQDWCRLWATEALRVLKPGGHLLSFGGTRTWHRLTSAIEDAGFEIRDSIAWLYGSGFPKSLDVSKAIDKLDAADERRARALEFTAFIRASGLTAQRIDALTGTNMGGHYTTATSQPAVATADLFNLLRPLLPEVPERIEELVRQRTVESKNYKAREVIGERTTGIGTGNGSVSYIADSENRDITAPATPAAQQWQGWGTALKPAHEPVVCARKPFSPVPSWEMVASVHHALGGLLWLSVSPAKRAALTSPSSPHALPEGSCASALASAALDTSHDESATTDTYNSPALASTSSSIATSWSAILAALSDPTTTSTTSTASSTTTALRTLNSLLAPVTSPSTMPRCGCLTAGSLSTAPSAASGSTDEWASWLHTLSRSVPETATEGIALAVASALAAIAEELSGDQAAGSTAAPAATTAAESKPGSAFEPIVVARKPLTGTVAANVLAHGTGALNIDVCRVEPSDRAAYEDKCASVVGLDSNRNGSAYGEWTGARQDSASPAGRWPTNVLLDGDMADELDTQTGTLKSGANPTRRGSDKFRDAYGEFRGQEECTPARGADSGGASRFFPVFRYQAKAPTRERPKAAGVAHPTCKPLELMRWLVRLTVGGRPDATVLDPFAGSGTTLEACLLEGVQSIGIEREAEYLPLIDIRIARAAPPPEDEATA